MPYHEDIRPVQTDTDCITIQEMVEALRRQAKHREGQLERMMEERDRLGEILHITERELKNIHNALSALQPPAAAEMHVR